MHHIHQYDHQHVAGKVHQCLGQRLHFPGLQQQDHALFCCLGYHHDGEQQEWRIDPAHESPTMQVQRPSAQHDIARDHCHRHGQPKNGQLPTDQALHLIAGIQQGINADAQHQEPQEHRMQDIVSSRIAADPETCSKGRNHLRMRNSLRRFTHRLPALHSTQPTVRFHTAQHRAKRAAFRKLCGGVLFLAQPTA